METLSNDIEFRRHKLALGLWESEGGAPAPHLSGAPARLEGYTMTGCSGRKQPRAYRRSTTNDCSAPKKLTTSKPAKR